jgi:hypothetical protein
MSEFADGCFWIHNNRTTRLALDSGCQSSLSHQYTQGRLHILSSSGVLSLSPSCNLPASMLSFLLLLLLKCQTSKDWSIIINLPLSMAKILPKLLLPSQETNVPPPRSSGLASQVPQSGRAPLDLLLRKNDLKQTRSLDTKLS